MRHTRATIQRCVAAVWGLLHTLQIHHLQLPLTHLGGVRMGLWAVVRIRHSDLLSAILITVDVRAVAIRHLVVVLKR